MRKTISVQAIKEKINNRILQTPNEDVRKELCMFLESVLHDTGNYNGFNYVEWLNGGAERWQKEKDAQASDRLYPKGLNSEVPQEYLGPEYLRRYY